MAPLSIRSLGKPFNVMLESLLDDNSEKFYQVSINIYAQDSRHGATDIFFFSYCNMLLPSLKLSQHDGQNLKEIPV